MPVIPQYQDKEPLDPDARGMPRPSFTTAAADAEAQTAAAMGKFGGAISSMGEGLQAVAERAKQIQEKKEAFGSKLQFDSFNSKMAEEDQAELLKAPPDGTGYTQSRMDALAQKGKQFIDSLPASQREEYTQRFANYLDNKHREYSATEAQLLNKHSTDQLNANFAEFKNRVFADPGSVGMAISEMEERVKLAPGISEAEKPGAIKLFKEGLKQTYGLKKYGESEEAATRAVGLPYAPSAKIEGAQEKFDSKSNGRVSRAPADVHSREQEAVSFFTSKGLSPHAAAAFVGRLSHESGGMRTGAVNPGDGSDGSNSVGLGQWNSGRAKQLAAFAARRGTSPNDFKTQLEFAWHELNSTETVALAGLKGARNAEEAAKAAIDFERPKGWSQYGYNVQRVSGYGDQMARTRRIMAGMGNADVPAPGAKDASTTNTLPPGAEGFASGDVPTPPVRPDSLGMTADDGTPMPPVRPASLGIDPNPTPEAVKEAAAGADPYLADLPLEMKLKIVQAARIGEANKLKLETERAVRQNAIDVENHKKFVSDLQFRAHDGKLTLPELDSVRDQLKDFNEYKSVANLIKESDDQARLTGEAFAKRATPGAIWTPDDGERLTAALKSTGVLEGIQKGDAKAAEELMGWFRDTGMATKEVRQFFDSVPRSGSPAQVQFAMQTLDRLERANPNAFLEAFGKNARDNLTAWQANLQRDPKAFQEELKTFYDPSQVKAREAYEKAGRAEAEKIEDDKIVKAFDDSWFHDPGKPYGPANVPAMGMLKAEFTDEYAKQYRISGGDSAVATKRTVEVLSQYWKVSPSSGNRLVKFPPEVLLGKGLPLVGGSGDWIKEQVEEAVKANGGHVPVLGTVWGAEPPKYALWAGSETTAEIDSVRNGRPLPDGRQSPTWNLIIDDPNTGLRKMVPFTLDVERAKKAAADIEAEGNATFQRDAASAGAEMEKTRATYEKLLDRAKQEDDRRNAERKVEADRRAAESPGDAMEKTRKTFEEMRRRAAEQGTMSERVQRGWNERQKAAEERFRGGR